MVIETTKNGGKEREIKTVDSAGPGDPDSPGLRVDRGAALSGPGEAQGVPQHQPRYEYGAPSDVRRGGGTVSATVTESESEPYSCTDPRTYPHAHTCAFANSDPRPHTYTYARANTKPDPNAIAVTHSSTCWCWNVPMPSACQMGGLDAEYRAWKAREVGSAPRLDTPVWDREWPAV